MQDLAQTGREVSFSWLFFFFFSPSLLKLGYLTEEGKITPYDSQFSNQPKPSPFASLHVHACKPFFLPRKRERKKKETQGPMSPD